MVAIKIDNPSGSSSNKGSCSAMADYLEKENKHKESENKEFFFNHRNDKISYSEVVKTIDSNCKGLGKNDAKFFTGSINLSESELKHLDNEPEKVKKYATEFFKVYAENFNRGIERGDLNYFCKLEYNRYYKGNDLDVKNGIAMQGDIKPGLNSHVHFIIGRKTLDGKKISPKTNHRATVNGPVTASFDRDVLIQKTEELFDKMFDYNRPINEAYKSFKTMKKNNFIDREKELIKRVDIDHEQQLFISSGLERKTEILVNKIEQINYKLSIKNNAFELINKDELLKHVDSAINGKTFWQLLNLEKLIANSEFINQNPNQMILLSLRNHELPLVDQSKSNAEITKKAFTQFVNQELPKSFALYMNDAFMEPAAFPHVLIQGSSNQIRPLLVSLIYADKTNSPFAKEESQTPYANLIKEINSIREMQGGDYVQKFTLTYINELSKHFKQSEINGALLTIKHLAKTDAKFNIIKNLNLFLAATLIQNRKGYNDKPNVLKIDGIRKYIAVINNKLSKGSNERINTDQTLDVEIGNNYSGKVYGYLNSIHGKLKREDYLGAENIIEIGPHKFIEQKLINENVDIIPDYNNSPINSEALFLEENPQSALGSSGVLLPSFKHININEDEDEYKKRKKKKKRKDEDRNTGMSM